jgi:hypothetical protein
VKNILIIMLWIAAGLLSAGASAQELYTAESPSSRLDRARGDAADARRRETDLQNQIAEQERTNATLRDQIRKVDTDPAGLMTDLVNVSDQAAALRKKVADQRAHRDAAEDRYDQARANAMDEYEQTQPMIAARNSVADAAAELDRLSQPILDRLSQDEGYQEAQALVDAAAQAGEAMQGFENVDPEAQADADAAFDLAMENVRGLEDAAINADPNAAEASKSLKLAQDMLDGLRVENEKKIATNPVVDGARFALDLEQKLLDDDAAELTTAEKRLSALRQTTQPGAGRPTELANQLKEGEDRLSDLNDQLDQAKVARDDAEQRLQFAQNAATGGPTQAAGSALGPPPAIDYSQPSYEPYTDDGYYYDDTYAYGGYPYDGYGYIYSSYPYRYGYYRPHYGYGYPYHSRYAYDPFFSPFYGYGYIGTGIYFGYNHRFRHHDYYRDHYAYYRHDRSDAWRTHYDFFRRRDDWRGGHGGDRIVTSHDGRTGFGNSRYDNARFNRAEVSRDRAARSNIDRARAQTAAAERDYRYRTGVNTYNYPGSTAWRARDQESAMLRARQYQTAERDRRAAVDSGRSRSGELRGADSTARRARAEEAASSDFTRARSEWRPRTSADETRGTRPNQDVGRSRSGDTGSSRSRSSDIGSSRSRSSDVGNSRSRSSDAGSSRSRASDAGSSGSRSGDVSRSRSAAPPSRDITPSRGRSAAPPSREVAPSRGRIEAAPAPSRSRGSSFRGGDAGGSARSRGSSTPPPDFGSSRSSSRGGSAAPSRSDGGSSRGAARDGGSFRGGSSASSSRGASAAPPSRGGSSASSSRGGGGSSSGSSRGGRGR